jgi:glycosyltransferase involved in cell wall biosynthesis
MKILVCAPSYPPYVRGGGEISTQLLCEGLRDAGLEVEVLAGFRSDALEESDGIRIHRVRSPNLYWSFDSEGKSDVQKAIWHLREGYDWRLPESFSRIIAATNPDLVHTSGIEDISPKMWKLARSMGKPVVHTIRSYTLLCRSASLRRGTKNCESLCFSCRTASAPKRRLSRYVNAVIGISRYVLERHVAHGFFGEAAKHVVMNIAGEEATGGAVSERQGPAAIGFLGRLSPEKGLERVFAALSRLPPDERPALLVAGWGKPAYEEELKRSSSGLDVRFLGKVPASELFKRIDLLVVPSLWNEPLGRIVLEANSHGLPVLATRRGGLPEMVAEGTTGWLFEPDDVAELAEAIRLRCSVPDALRAMRSDCLRAGESYSSAAIVGQHVAIYEELLRGAPRMSALPLEG